MPHDTPLIATIVAGIGLAFVFGALAFRLRISPLVGYLVAGVLVGPVVPGFVADQHLANQLAEIGIILLMFGVGLHFSLEDLLDVRSVVLPGALGRMALATLLGVGLGELMGWRIGASFLFGLALSVASTVVALRALQERRLMESERGRIAVAWLIVEDLAMVLALVLAPAIARLLDVSFEGGAAPPSVALGPVLTAIGVTLVKVAVFVALMLVVGKRAIPWLLHAVAHTGSRELFRLAVLAVALCVAYGAAVLFGVSFALGAFFAGTVLSESQLSQRAAQETLPLRDAFAVLFFVSVGMLFNPRVLVDHPGALAATILIITLGRAAIAFAIVRMLRQPLSTAFTLAASLAQIGEFSFILAGLGVSLGLMPAEARDLILAGAIFSIVANPLLFAVPDRLRSWLERREAAAQVAQTSVAQTSRAQTPEAQISAAQRPLTQTPEPKPPPEPEPLPVTGLTRHAVLVGYGRVGSVVGDELRRIGWPLLVIEDRQKVVERLHAERVEALVGNAADPRLLAAANIEQAATIFIAIPEAFEAGQIVEQARHANPAIQILARAHSQAEVEHLRRLGADLVVMGEREIARAMLVHTIGAAGEIDHRAPQPLEPSSHDVMTELH
jgi:CPA2 family monovalent cation:H+ antiporter-2